VLNRTEKDRVIYAIIVVNLLGTILGFVYYKNQLFDTSPTLWLFVPDCPIYTLLFAVSLLLLMQDIRWDLYNFVVSIGVMKYGFWTLFTTLLYSEFFLSPSRMTFYSVLFIFHFGMMAEALLLFHEIEVKRTFIPLSLFWFLLNDIFDYSQTFSTHPWLPYSVTMLSTISKAAFAMSFFFTFFAYYVCKSTRKPILFGF